MKLKTQIFTLGLLSSILPLALVSVLLISIYNAELNRIATNNLRSITTAQIDIIDNFFYERDVSMSILSDFVVLHNLLETSNKGVDISASPDRAVLETIFTAQKERQGFLHSITAVDRNLRIVVCTEPTQPNEISNLGAVEALDELGRTVRFSKILDQGEHGASKRCLVATRAIYDKNDVLIGYLVEEISLSFFENLRISTDLIQEGYIYITDGEGGLITAGSGDTQRQEYKLGSNERGNFPEMWANRDLSQPVGVVQYQIDGKNYLSSYGGFTNARWQILSSVCLDNILHTRERFMQVLLIALMVTLLLIFAVDIIMYRMVTAPIERMLKTFDYIREHKNFSKRIDSISHNEIGVIATEVNNLLDDIEHTICHQEESLRILKERAERDSMTQLFNKGAIEDVLALKIESACVNKRLLACVLVDIDDFKSFNTRFGHVAGDAVISFVASLMREFSGDTAGRIGGDEFIMCLDSCSSRNEVSMKLEKFLTCLRHGTALSEDGTLVPVHCSIGVTLLQGRTGPTYEAIIQSADAAMYSVKNSTKNGYKIVP